MSQDNIINLEMFVKPNSNKTRFVKYKFTRNGEVILERTFYGSNVESLVTKFDDVMSFITDFFKHYPTAKVKVDEYFYHYITLIESKEYQLAADLMIDLLEYIDSLIDDYFDLINFTKYIRYTAVDESVIRAKRNKSRIISFTLDDLIAFYKSSMLARIYALMYISKPLALPHRYLNDAVYKVILRRISDTGALYKLDGLIRTKLLNNIKMQSVSELWKFIEINMGYDPYILAIEIFNFVIRIVLPSIRKNDVEKGKRNFLGYMMSTINNHINFLLRTKINYVIIIKDAVINSLSDSEFLALDHSIVMDREKELFIASLSGQLKKDIFEELVINGHVLGVVKDKVRLSSPIIKYIVEPLTTKVLDIETIYIFDPEIVKIFTLFWFHNIHNIDKDLFEIKKLLKSYAVKIDDNEWRESGKDLMQIMDKVIDYYPIKTNMSISKQHLKKLMVYTIETFMQYKYIDIFKGFEQKIKWGRFISEYVKMLSYITSDYYEGIEIMKKKFKISTERTEF